MTVALMGVRCKGASPKPVTSLCALGVGAEMVTGLSVASDPAAVEAVLVLAGGAELVCAAAQLAIKIIAAPAIKWWEKGLFGLKNSVITVCEYVITGRHAERLPQLATCMQLAWELAVEKPPNSYTSFPARGLPQSGSKGLSQSRRLHGTTPLAKPAAAIASGWRLDYHCVPARRNPAARSALIHRAALPGTRPSSCCSRGLVVVYCCATGAPPCRRCAAA